MLKSTIKDGSGLEKKTCHMPVINKHLIPFTGADRHNDNLVISGRPKGGTSRFETYATMQIVTEEQLPDSGRVCHRGYNQGRIRA